MKHQEGTFKGIRSLNIYYQSWIPDIDPKAVLLIVHGLGEHSGRYTNVVNHFVPLGFAVYGFDLVGHGRSDGGREQVERFEDFSDTLSTYFEMIRSWQPGKPIFLLGHSMGGMISIYYLLENQSKFTGAIISAALIRVPDNISPMTVTLGKILSAIAPKAGIVPLDPTGVSRDQKVVDAYINDPLVYQGKTPARLSAEMLKAMSRITAEAGKITLPFITVQGTADKLVNPGDARVLFDKASSTDKTIKMYDGYYHEVLNDPGHEIVLRDIEDWLSARI